MSQADLKVRLYDDRLRDASVRRGGPSGPPALIDAEGEQHVARIADEAAVSRVHIRPAAGNERSGTFEPAAVRLHAVDRLEFAVRVERPQNLAVGSGVSPQPAVQRSREDGPWNGGHRRALRCAAG